MLGDISSAVPRLFKMRSTKYVNNLKTSLFNALEIGLTYFQAGGEPFEILAPDTRYVFVSALKHIKELDSAPDTVLSLQAASKQMLQPVYTMTGFNWFDRRGTEGVGFVRALRTMLTANLPQILPDLSNIIRTRFEEIHESHPTVNGMRSILNLNL